MPPFVLLMVNARPAAAEIVPVLVSPPPWIVRSPAVTRIVPEFIQWEATADNVALPILQWMKDPASRKALRRKPLLASVLFLDAGSAFTPSQLGHNVGRSRAVPGEQHHAMEPQVRSFAYEVQFITVLGR